MRIEHYHNLTELVSHVFLAGQPRHFQAGDAHLELSETRVLFSVWGLEEWSSSSSDGCWNHMRQQHLSCQILQMSSLHEQSTLMATVQFMHINLLDLLAFDLNHVAALG